MIAVERRFETAEDLRLLYTAATREGSQLIISKPAAPKTRLKELCRTSWNSSTFKHGPS